MGIIRRTRVVKMSLPPDPDFAPIWDKICSTAVLGADKSYIADTGYGGARSLQYRTSGKWHFEINLGTGDTQYAMVGISYGTPWDSSYSVWDNKNNTCPIYGYPAHRIAYAYGRLTYISGNFADAGFGNNVVVGFDLDADMNTLRVRTTTMDATYQINGRNQTDPIYVIGGAGVGPIYNMRLIAYEPFAWTPMEGYLPFCK